MATWNLEWFFDDYTGDNFLIWRSSNPPPARAVDMKLAGVAKAIAQIKPTILALQEIENRRVLYHLTKS